MVPRLNAGLALASDECVWNGDVGRGENGELGPLLTTVESDRRRRIVLLLLLSAVVIEDLRAASWRWCAWVELLVAGARSGQSPAFSKSSTTTRLSARPPARRRIAQVHLMSPCLRSERRAPRVQ